MRGGDDQKVQDLEFDPKPGDHVLIKRQGAKAFEDGMTAADRSLAHLPDHAVVKPLKQISHAKTRHPEN